MSRPKGAALVVIVLALLASMVLIADALGATATVVAPPASAESDQSTAKPTLADLPLTVSGRGLHSSTASVNTLSGESVWSLPLGAADGALLGGALVDDGFESGLGQWTVSGNQSAWGVTSYRAASGSYSAYCVGESVEAPGPYPHGSASMMTAGPFDFSAATAVTLEFDYWGHTASEMVYTGPDPGDFMYFYDQVYVMFSTDNSTFHSSGDPLRSTSGWVHRSVDLSTYLGDSSVWVMFSWSDYPGSYVDEGIYIDNVQLVTDGGLPPVISSLSPTSGLTTGGNVVTITGTDLSGATAITFGGTPATDYTIDSSTKITAVTPPRPAGTVQVQVTTPGGPSSNTAADDFTYATAIAINSDGFEAGLGQWTIDGSPTWGVTSYRAADGSHSAYCVGSSIAAPGPYPSNVDAFMYAGPYDLSAASSATLDFDQSLNTENGYDWCYAMASSDGMDFSGMGWSGDSGGWEHQTLDLSAVPDGSGGFVDMVGDSSVWIGFWFVSDGDVQDEGVYLDNVQVFSDGAAPPVTYSSIRGSDRFDTALKVSKALFAKSLPAGSGVVLAPGWESYQEALCGAPLAAAYGGPVLLSSKTDLYSGVAAELMRLHPDYVFCIGLTGTGVADAVKAILPTANVTRINGTLDNVYHMSYLVAKKLGDKVGDMSSATGIVTIGYNFPDAIGVSALACFEKWPILLTDHGDGTAMNTYAVQAMNELGITTFVKAGTYAPDPAGITGMGNCSGTDRYFTNANVANWAKANAGLSFAQTAMCTGDKFPDALAAGPYLGMDGGMLLLSPLNGPVPTSIANLLSVNASAVEHFTFIACIEPVIGQVKGLLP